MTNPHMEGSFDTLLDKITMYHTCCESHELLVTGDSRRDGTISTLLPVPNGTMILPNNLLLIASFR